MINHRPVLLKEVMEVLNIREDGIYLDATAGGGGHSMEILRRLSDSGVLICSDRDTSSVERLRTRFDDKRVLIKRSTFSGIPVELLSSQIKHVDGVLFDLGLSMYQLRDMDRGFSFDSEARLDMRMDRSIAISAWDVVNGFSQKEIEKILKDYSDERYYRKIARVIVNRRRREKINTCRELASLVAGVYGRRGKIHPATKTFQAIRIAVNDEIEELRHGLKNAMEILSRGGRLCVISYHSIEDRVVKHFMRDMSKDNVLRSLTKKPITPSRDEVRSNPAARSAKLRGAEKI